MERVWAFYRRSTNKQELSIDGQQKECRAFAAARGWEIVREFIPARGYASGMSIDRDPEFLEMARLAELGRHGVSRLITYDVSRFGRLNPEDKFGWEWHFKRHGIRVTYVRDDFKNDGSLGDGLAKFLKHSEAYEYSRKLSEVTLRGAKSHAALGHSTGGRAPYGYDRLLIDGAGNPIRILQRHEWKESKLQRIVWAPSPSQRAIVEEMFETFSKGVGVRRIVQDLNQRKIPPPGGRFWHQGIVRYILKNRAYLGERIYNKRSYKAYRRGEKGDLFNPRTEWVTFPGAHEPIISQELFNKVQGQFKTWKMRVAGVHRRPYLLTGIGVCGRCGYKLTGRPSRNNRGYGPLIYDCSGYARSGTSVCQSLHLPTEQLDSIVLGSVRERLREPSFRQEVEETLAIVYDEQFGSGAERRVVELEDEISRVGQEIERFVDAVRGGSFSPALAKALQDAEDRLTELRGQLKDEQAKLGARTSPQMLIQRILGLADDFDRLWAKCATPEGRKVFIQAFVHQVNIQREGARMDADCWLYKIPSIKMARDSELGITDHLKISCVTDEFHTVDLRG